MDVKQRMHDSGIEHVGKYEIDGQKEVAHNAGNDNVIGGWVKRG